MVKELGQGTHNLTLTNDSTLKYYLKYTIRKTITDRH